MCSISVRTLPFTLTLAVFLARSIPVTPLHHTATGKKLRDRVATQCMILKASCADCLNPDGTLNPYPDPMACRRC